MTREELIQKWLDHNLNSEEQKAFEQLEDYKDLMQLNDALKSFKSPDFSVGENYKALQPNLKKKAAQTWYKPLLKIAAVLAICFSVYFYTTTLDSTFNTEIASQTTIELPDASEVILNANSYLVFNES